MNRKSFASTERKPDGRATGQAIAIIIMLCATTFGLTNLAGSLRPPTPTTQPSTHNTVKVVASGLTQSDAAQAAHAMIRPSTMISGYVPLTMPESYLGVGSPLAMSRGGNSGMRMQGFWLSSHSPGTPKEYGDPFNAKWDPSASCGNCWPVGGQFQPDHYSSGDDFALYVGTSDNPYLQIYDAAYQPKPGYNDQFGVGHLNVIFNPQHPCGDPSLPPTSCSSGNVIDYNRISQRWCSLNSIEAGDNQPGAPGDQCDTQAMSITTIYSLYYPDSTPNYFGDDVLADQWTVPASPISGTDQGGSLVPSYAYSQTWTNFMGQPDRYYLPVYNGYHQWRLNVNVPLDNDHSIQGISGQNNYGVRLGTSNANTVVYPLQWMPITTVAPDGAQITSYLAEVPASDADRLMDISLFDPGDTAGHAYIELISPPTAHQPMSYPVSFDAYIHDNHYPPGPDIVYRNIDQLDVSGYRQQSNDRWIDIVHHILPFDEYQGGYWMLRFSYSTPATDRMTWLLSIGDTFLPTPTHVPTATDTATSVATSAPPATDTPTSNPTATPTVTGTLLATNTPTDTPTMTPTASNTATALTSATSTATPTNNPVPTDTATNTPLLPTSTGVPTSILTNTPALATNTPAPTNTPGGPTDTPVPTDTPGPSATDTPFPSTPTTIATATPMDCPNGFVDITGNIFYVAIHHLYYGGVVSGTDASHYSPSTTSTRAQFAKVVVKGFGLPFYTPATPSFTDVPPTFFAYLYIETGFHAAILSGYTADQCIAANVPFPCYQPNRFITRAELTRLVVKAANYPIITSSAGPTFVDVPANFFAYAYIETAYAHNVIRGVDATHFQPNRNIRRDEMAQIVFKGVTTP